MSGCVYASHCGRWEVRRTARRLPIERLRAMRDDLTWKFRGEILSLKLVELRNNAYEPGKFDFRIVRTYVDDPLPPPDLFKTKEEAVKAGRKHYGTKRVFLDPAMLAAYAN